MAIRLIVLGSGTAVPDVNRAPSGYLIIANNTRWLLDCGSGTIRRILLAKEDPLKLSGIFLTHLHPDHCSDLPAILHAMVVPPGRDPTQSLHLVGTKRLKDFYEKCILSLIKKPFFEVVFHQPEGKIVLPEIEVETIYTEHTEDSLAYKLKIGDKTIVFTGDTSFNERLIEFSMNADILVADSSYTEKTKKGHMSAKECGRLAKLARVNLLILSHLYPVASADEFLKEASIEFSDSIILAKDLMVIEL